MTTDNKALAERLRALARRCEPSDDADTEMPGTFVSQPDHVVTATLREAAAALTASPQVDEGRGVVAATVVTEKGRDNEVGPHSVLLEPSYESWLDQQPPGTSHRLYTTPQPQGDASPHPDDEASIDKAWQRFQAAVATPPVSGDGEDQRERVMAALADAIGGAAYDCLRVWEAWQVGTMTDGDFHSITDNPDRVGEIADAAIAALSPTQARPDEWPPCPECGAGVLFECPACSAKNYPDEPAPTQVPGGGDEVAQTHDYLQAYLRAELNKDMAPFRAHRAALPPTQARPDRLAELQRQIENMEKELRAVRSRPGCKPTNWRIDITDGGSSVWCDNESTARAQAFDLRKRGYACTIVPLFDRPAPKAEVARLVEAADLVASSIAFRIDDPRSLRLDQLREALLPFTAAQRKGATNGQE